MPQVSDEVMFITIILGIAIFILIVLLAGVVLIHHYEHRRNDKFTWRSLVSTMTDFFPKAGPKEEPAPMPLADGVATSVSEPIPNIELESGSPAVGNTILLPEDRTTEVRPTSEIKALSLDAGLTRDIKILNWVVCLIIASYVAFLGYDRLQHYLFLLLQLSSYFYGFAIILAFISPTCIAVAWLRLTGVRWRQALLLFPFVPVGVQVIYFIGNINN